MCCLRLPARRTRSRDDRASEPGREYSAATRCGHESSGPRVRPRRAEVQPTQPAAPRVDRGAALPPPQLFPDDDGREARFDLLTEPLFPRWKFQARAQVGQLLVDEKSWTDGRDFEEHAARLTEVDRREVTAIADVGNSASVLDQFVLQF